MKSVIIVGGGDSIKQEWKNGLFDKIKGQEIWSLNFAYKTMPYFPNAEIFVDRSFFKNNETDLEFLYKNGVKLVARRAPDYACLKKEIEMYDVTRLEHQYTGRLALKERMIYAGQDGLCGTFALSYAIACGYDRIYLLGYDFGTPTAEQKETHYYQEKTKELKIKSAGAGNPHLYRNDKGKVKQSVNDYKIFLNTKDVEILNVSLQSNIPFFKKISYEEFYKRIEEFSHV